MSQVVNKIGQVAFEVFFDDKAWCCCTDQHFLFLSRPLSPVELGALERLGAESSLRTLQFAKNSLSSLPRSNYLCVEVLCRSK